MKHYRSNRILPIILTIVIIIVAIAALVALGRLLFTGFGSTTSSSDVNVARQSLLSTTAESSVQMTVRGPIVADEDFRSYQITISPSERLFQSFSGYLEDVTGSQRLSNNTAAYEEFVNALAKARLADGRELTGEDNNVLGVCATGNVYEFAIRDAGETDAYFWTSTCSGSSGSLRGSASQISELFLSQIPDGSSIEEKLAL